MNDDDFVFIFSISLENFYFSKHFWLSNRKSKQLSDERKIITNAVLVTSISSFNIKNNLKVTAIDFPDRFVTF